MYRLIPSGGLMSAASTRITIMMPNHTKSTPTASSDGVRIGMVVTSMAKLSIKVPSSR